MQPTSLNLLPVPSRPTAAMKWSEGDQWLLSLDLPAGSHEFKLVAVAPPAGEGAGLYANWEAGPNRTLKVRGDACGLSGWLGWGLITGTQESGPSAD